MYSQKDEESWILQHCGPVGRFLDIGAFDGVNYSNTMALVELGWEGIMVEPSPPAFQALHANHGHRNKIQLIHAAVTLASDGLVKFWPQATTFSTTELENTMKFAGEGFRAPYWTGAISMLSLIEALQPPIDVVSIDTEGSSVDLLIRLPMDLIRPRVVVVEHDGRVDEVNRWAVIHRYQHVVSNEENICLIPK